MPERFLLDSSAFIAFLQAEPGAPRVLDLLEKAARVEAEVVACFVSLTEVQYITAYDHGEESARKAITDLKQLNIRWQHSDDALCASAAELKAAHRISFADAFVVASAFRWDAVLVHKDPEFATVPAPLKQEMLPPKIPLPAAT
ncbi:MAG: PIN domain-containing protein [Verrucomicrobia bacterium]|nr:PIN domain-containing protein [Verrucomicrobiota bacterium]